MLVLHRVSFFSYSHGVWQRSMLHTSVFRLRHPCSSPDVMVLVFNSPLFVGLCLKASSCRHLKSCFMSAACRGKMSKTPGPRLLSQVAAAGSSPWLTSVWSLNLPPRGIAHSAPNRDWRMQKLECKSGSQASWFCLWKTWKLLTLMAQNTCWSEASFWMPGMDCV
jgi:hypothetical protein